MVGKDVLFTVNPHVRKAFLSTVEYLGQIAAFLVLAKEKLI
jgi:hypothetical protein